MTAESFRAGEYTRQNGREKPQGAFHNRITVTEGTNKPSNVKPHRIGVDDDEFILSKNDKRFPAQTSTECRELNPHKVTPLPEGYQFPVASFRGAGGQEGVEALDLDQAIAKDLNNRNVRGKR